MKKNTCNRLGEVSIVGIPCQLVTSDHHEEKEMYRVSQIETHHLIPRTRFVPTFFRINLHFKKDEIIIL